MKQPIAKPVRKTEKYPIYFHIPGLDIVSTRFEKVIIVAVKQCYFTVEPRVVLRPDSSCQQLKRTCCLLIIATMLCTSVAVVQQVPLL